jgi:hypothetical protein
MTGLRVGIYLAILGALAVAGWRVSEWRQGYLERDAAVEARDLAVAQRDQAIAGLQAGLRAVNDVSEKYQRELQALRDRPLSDAPVRLCKPSGRPPVPAPRPAESRSDGPRGPKRLVDSGDGADHHEGPDIRPDLNAYALSGERESARLRALQEYVRVECLRAG